MRNIERIHQASTITSLIDGEWKKKSKIYKTSSPQGSIYSVEIPVRKKFNLNYSHKTI